MKVHLSGPCQESWEDGASHVGGVAGGEQLQGLGGELPNGEIPVAHLPLQQVRYQGDEVRVETCYEDRKLEEGVGAGHHSNEVSHCEDVYAMREGALSPHILLECRTGCSSTIHLPVEHGQET